MSDSPLLFPEKPWVIKPQVADEVFTDRAEFLDYFYETARKIPTRRPMSTVLLGQRRMGKTEIFRRVVNRLFFEQDPHSPDAVVPVYYMFSDTEHDTTVFAHNYLENFMRYYVGFYTHQPDIVRLDLRGSRLVARIEESRHLYPFGEDLDVLLMYHSSMMNGDMPAPAEDATSIPRRISDIFDSSIAMFLDEFQNTHLPQNNFRIVGYMQNAVESNTCPHFVTGSAMSILAREILGRGSLYGRFESVPIQTLSGYWGTELVKKTARYYEATVPELMAPVVAERCGGNPFYISAVVRQSVRSGIPLVDEIAINSALAVDISSGFIWDELNSQVKSWIERVNQQNITKWILYLSALEEGERISLERVQRELKAKEGKDVPLEEIREVLIRLSRGDLIDYKSFGNWFSKMDDPILLEFIKVWGQVELEGYNAGEVYDALFTEYASFKKRISEYRGYLGEVFMSQVLLSSQDASKLPLPGRFFNSTEDIQMPRPLSYVRHRVRIGSGQGKEIDLLGAIGIEKWVCQSKWQTTRKVGSSVLHELIEQAKLVQADYPKNSIRMWIFAHQGLTAEAEKLAKKKGILWSDRAQLDGVLGYLGLRTLPILEE